jgi:hypothetical protein
MKGRIAVIAATAAVLTLLITAVSVASSTFTPKLGPPNHHKVRAERNIALKVKAPFANTVYVQIEPGKRLSKGFLSKWIKVNHGCDFTSLKRWRGHKGWWIYRPAHFTFRGWWARIPGTYHWQAESFVKSPPCSFANSTCIFDSSVGSFKVVR